MGSSTTPGHRTRSGRNLVAIERWNRSTSSCRFALNWVCIPTDPSMGFTAALRGFEQNSSSHSVGIFNYSISSTLGSPPVETQSPSIRQSDLGHGLLKFNTALISTYSTTRFSGQARRGTCGCEKNSPLNLPSFCGSICVPRCESGFTSVKGMHGECD